MEGKIKTLKVLLWLHIVLGFLLTAYATFAITIMQGIGFGIATLLLGLFLFVALPYYAKASLVKGSATPALWHSIYIIVFVTILIPLGIWQLFLAYKLNEHFKGKTA